MTKAHELAEDEAMMDGGEMAQIRAGTVQQTREEVYAALPACRQLPLFGGGVARL